MGNENVKTLACLLDISSRSRYNPIAMYSYSYRWVKTHVQTVLLWSNQFIYHHHSTLSSQASIVSISCADVPWRSHACIIEPYKTHVAGVATVCS